MFSLCQILFIRHGRLLLEKDEEWCVGIARVKISASPKKCAWCTHMIANPIVMLQVPATVNWVSTTQYSHHTAPFHKGRPISTKYMKDKSMR
jgi:hypothetical protein